ncbi:SDR family NAD(P)-dependent oxidoreductase [Mycobacterium sp.]|uniref:SDR family NAD(P)-dependent oxidoreductase n=1 Tax=Mycobacterium sp. TaxID=1785 RepID=UPI0025F1554D|nr:SDR family NAD(P)-dependent oxidoreductase [Mycobacterium sp.]
MTKPLDGCVVLVTGGGRGIGRAHCLELADQGAVVVVNDPGVGRDGHAGDGTGPAASVVTEIEQRGGRAVAHTGSVTVWDEAADMIATAVSTLGTLTGVVNNAGIVRDAMITGASEADWDAVIAVHLKGTFAVTKHACDYWRAQSKAGQSVTGRIVNTVSGAGLWGNVSQSAYGAAKAAIANLTVTTALEMRKYQVTANAISPLAVTRLSEEFFSGPRASDPALEPSRSAPVVAWLQSPQSSWLTGQILRINGANLSRINGFTEDPQRYQARNGATLEFGEIGQAASLLWGVAPRGLGGQ